VSSTALNITPLPADERVLDPEFRHAPKIRLYGTPESTSLLGAGIAPGVLALDAAALQQAWALQGEGDPLLGEGDGLAPGFVAECSLGFRERAEALRQTAATLHYGDEFIRQDLADAPALLVDLEVKMSAGLQALRTQYQHLFELSAIRPLERAALEIAAQPPPDAVSDAVDRRKSLRHALALVRRLCALGADRAPDDQISAAIAAAADELNTLEGACGAARGHLGAAGQVASADGFACAELARHLRLARKALSAHVSSREAALRLVADLETAANLQGDFTMLLPALECSCAAALRELRLAAVCRREQRLLDPDGTRRERLWSAFLLQNASGALEAMAQAQDRAAGGIAEFEKAHQFGGAARGEWSTRANALCTLFFPLMRLGKERLNSMDNKALGEATAVLDGYQRAVFGPIGALTKEFGKTHFEIGWLQTELAGAFAQVEGQITGLRRAALVVPNPSRLGMTAVRSTLIGRELGRAAEDPRSVLAGVLERLEISDLLSPPHAAKFDPLLSPLTALYRHYHFLLRQSEEFIHERAADYVPGRKRARQ
jgi:hypothetical protein